MTGPHTTRSVPELISDAFAQLGKLVSNEIDLAKAEVADKAAQAAKAAGMIGAGAVLLIPALVVLLFAAAAALISSGFSAPVAYLCTGGAAAAVSGILIAVGIGRLSGDAMKPKETLGQLQRDKMAAKEMVR